MTRGVQQSSTPPTHRRQQQRKRVRARAQAATTSEVNSPRVPRDEGATSPDQAHEARSTPGLEAQTASQPRRRWLGTVARTLEAGVMAAAGLWAIASVVGLTQADDATVVPGVKLAGRDISGMTREDLEEVAREMAFAGLDRPLTLRAGDVTHPAKARELGAVPVPAPAIEAALLVGHRGNFLADLQERTQARRGEIDITIGYAFDEEVALTRLLALAPSVQKPSLPTRFDFDNRKVLPAERGTGLLAYDALSSVAVGLASGSREIQLAVTPLPGVADPLAELGHDLDIGIVLGRYSTPYSTDTKAVDRTHNLKVGAARLDGFVLMPGESFSFNDIVGPRTTEAGFRYAPGITSGEVVDVVGGGICQVSSTLYAAAFFGGLELVSARPHSRPSGYVDMGLDSTVVYGAIDMKLRNQFEFPVVFHMVVHQGKVEVELLGPQRTYQVAFERKVEEVLPYSSVVRDDPKLRTGATSIAQRGKRGFKVKRIRKLYQAGKLLKTEDWDLNYPPTREIIRRGSNPAGKVPEAKTLMPLRDPANEMRIVQ
ncbi:MAG: VanW family protein [Nannocystaceae bacterium]